METMLNEVIDHYPAAEVSVAFYDFATGFNLDFNSDKPFHPASLIKVPVMAEVFHQASQGRLSLDEEILITNQFISIADKSIFSLYPQDDAETSLYQRVGNKSSLIELIRLMITHSSNLATNILIKKVTAEKVTAFMQDISAPDLRVLRGPEDNRAYALGINNSATAKGMLQLMILLAEGRLVSPQASQQMVDVLLEQQYNEGIPSGLPDGVSVAHKTGWNPRLYHDAGIVFPSGQSPYCLVIMTRGIEKDQDAHELVSKISSLCYKQAGAFHRHGL